MLPNIGRQETVLCNYEFSGGFLLLPILRFMEPKPLLTPEYTATAVKKRGMAPVPVYKGCDCPLSSPCPLEQTSQPQDSDRRGPRGAQVGTGPGTDLPGQAVALGPDTEEPVRQLQPRLTGFVFHIISHEKRVSSDVCLLTSIFSS